MGPRTVKSLVVSALALAACSAGQVADRQQPPPPPNIGGTGFAGAGVAGSGGVGGVGPTPGPAVAGAGGISPPLTGAPVSAANEVPPVSGGTLLILADGVTAFAADPDRDTLSFADLKRERLIATVALNPGDEPGRAIEDGAGHVLVLLRRGGALVSVDIASATIAGRHPVCPAPRGIARDAQSVYVACAGGELVTLATSTLQPVRQVKLDRDLRDVVVSGDKLFISRFRSAELLVVAAASGQILDRRVPPGSAAARTTLTTMSGNTLRAADPVVAWRLRPGPNGGAVMIHQEATNTELSTTMGGYAGGMCRGAMGAAVTNFSDTGPPTTSGQLMFTILPVDFAFSADGKQVAVVAAGSTTTFGGPGSSVTLMDASALADDNGGCIFPSPPAPPPGQDPVDFRPPIGAPTAVAFDGLGRVVAQTREPARLEILSNHGGTILLDETSRVDTGHSIFHSATAFGLACASCHPEGGDDGRVWRFQNLGLRRTQSLRGGILATAPFHWDGQLTDLGQLMGEVFTKRMGGPTLTDEQVKVLGSWLDRIPLLPASAPADPAAVGRGKLLFQDPKVGCTTCHNGPALTNNMTVDVGTGQALQVPSLRGVGARAPYMHDGCAKTLLDRFTPSCGGGDRHGVTSQLSGAQLADLVAYLETL